MSTIYQFGEFRLDPASRELWRSKEELALPPKAFGCLVYLIEHRDRAVGREELLHAVWGHAHLTDNTLDQAISDARRMLGDTGDEQRFIKTIRGFGYHWVAPVETVRTPLEAVREWGVAHTGPGHRPVWLGMAVVLFAVAALAGTAVYKLRGIGPGDLGGEVVPIAEGEIALMLPVAVEAEERHAWMRLGLMDLVAQRLRATGLSMVPSDTVIALAHGLASEPDPDELARLTETTGAGLVLEGRAHSRGTRWWVSLRSLTETQPPLAALGEAEDVLEAARLATDQLGVSLGLAPSTRADTEPGLAALIHKVTAATLAQQHDLALSLIEEAHPKLTRHPEVRFQRALIDFFSHQLDAAQTALESLLAQTPALEPILHARALHIMGWVHMFREQPGRAELALEEAAHLATGEDAGAILGRIRSVQGLLALGRGDLETARVHFAHARVALLGTGDALSMASLDNYLGMLEGQRDRYSEALRYFSRASERHAALNYVDQELINVANVILAHVGLLDPQPALALMPRMNELLAQTSNQRTAAIGHLGRAYLLDTTGQSEAAQSALAEILSATDCREDLQPVSYAALVLRAEIAARHGAASEAAGFATEAVEQIPPDFAGLAEERGRAWLILVRAHLALEHRTAAAEAAAALDDWAEQGAILPPQIYAALAQAELAAADGRIEAAETAYERALALADTSGAPLRALRVAESYIPWLLADEPHGTPDTAHAVAVAERLAEYADRHYDAALLQLRVAHAMGARSAWRRALARAQSLAAERKIPFELLAAPRVVRDGRPATQF